MVMLEMIGCSAPYQEAVEQRLVEQTTADDFNGDGPALVLIHCDRPERWADLKSHVDQGVVCVAVLPELMLQDYAKALRIGASGVVQLDMPSSVTADVIRSAAQGEVVLPRHVAHSIALLAERQKPRTNLEASEIELLRALATGETIVDLAAERFFSERTLRRHLQGIYLKLGSRNRDEAVAAAVRAGLLD